jgi:pyocin large subunit-like protein
MAKQKMLADQELRRSGKSLKINLTVKEPIFSIAENKLKKVFVDKSEAIEIMA